jgi:hypothetical protein
LARSEDASLKAGSNVFSSLVDRGWGALLMANAALA